MNRIFLLILILLSFHKTNAQIIHNPAFDFTNTGLFSIKSIQRNDTATNVAVHISFLPNWWTKFGKDIFLEDAATGKKYLVKGIKGAEFDKELWTPKSGDTLVTLQFPPLDKHVKKLNYGEGDKAQIFGIALDGKTATNKTPGIPATVQKWLDKQLSLAKVKTLKANYDADFFKTDSIKIVGYIKGYDKRAGFSSGIIYNGNNLTKEQFPTTIRIYEDGRFEGQILAIHPINSALMMNEQWISFYAEPGTTVGIILDWKEFLMLDRYRDRSRTFQVTTLLGANKTISKELADLKLNVPDYASLEKLRNTIPPDEFKKDQMNKWFAERKRVDSILKQQNLLPKTKALLKSEVDVSYASYLFEYEMSRDYYKSQDSANAVLKIPTPANYYDFINQINLNNNVLLISQNFSTFINRFEFSSLFPQFSAGTSNDYFAALDSASFANFKTKDISLIFNVAKLRSLSFRIDYAKDNNDIKSIVQSAKKNMNTPFLKEEADRLVKLNEKKKLGYELPNTAGAKVFKKIIDKYKGKVLIIDFWAQWCGPCRSGIENSLENRKKYKNHPAFDFIFITDMRGTPDTNFFNDYNEKNQLLNSYRVSADDYLALRELFKFNGIPRYVLVDENGRISDDDFKNHNFMSELVKYFPEKFTPIFSNDKG